MTPGGKEFQCRIAAAPEPPGLVGLQPQVLEGSARPELSLQIPAEMFGFGATHGKRRIRVFSGHLEIPVPEPEQQHEVTRDRAQIDPRHGVGVDHLDRVGSMKMYHFNKEKLRELQNERAELVNKNTEIHGKTADRMMLEDLAEV